MKSLEIKSFPFECKVDMDNNTFEGYAAVFGNIDSYRDVIEPGAFKKTLQESSHRVKVLWQHDPWTPIGKPISMSEDSKGLHVKAKISETNVGKDALVLLRDGVINELSIGYDTVKEEYDKQNNIRKLKEIRLWEFSPVTWAANDLAVITDIKGIDNLEPLLTRVRGFSNAVKAGRVLSEKNVQLVKQAIEALQALLEAAEPEDSTQGDSKAATHNDEMKSLLEELREYKKTIRRVN